MIKVIGEKVLLCSLSYLVADHLIKVKLYTLHDLLQCYIHCNLHVLWHSLHHSFLTTCCRLSDSTSSSDTVMFCIELIHLHIILICISASFDYSWTLFNLTHITDKCMMLSVHMKGEFVSDRPVLDSMMKVSSQSKDLKIDDVNLRIDCESNEACHHN